MVQISNKWCKIITINFELIFGVVHCPLLLDVDALIKLNTSFVVDGALTRKIVIMGDTNMSGIDWDSLTRGSSLLELLLFWIYLFRITSPEFQEITQEYKVHLYLFYIFFA